MFLLVAKEASSTTARFFAAAVREQNPPGPAVLQIDGRPAINFPAWTEVTPGGVSIRTSEVVAAGLVPGKSYPAQLIVGGISVERASVKTHPQSLPRFGDPPFRVLLGSCFCLEKDKAGTAGRRVVQLPADAQPDMNILCGDQVYLDAPWYDFTLNRLSKNEIERRTAEKYERAWSPDANGWGFAGILERGPNYFLADDHELWNNAPFKSFALNTWDQASRDDWKRVALELYRLFQSPRATHEFSVGQLSFYLADTRVSREGDLDGSFLAPNDLRDLRRWIGHLTGPGVLVLGQPLFTKPAKSFWKPEVFSDYGLPDYEAQYRELVQAVTSTSHSIIVLTGDVHFGRVSWCPLPNGAEIIEIISSPLSLVDARAGKKWERPPDTFPYVDMPGAPARTVLTAGALQEWVDHFLTLDFSATGNVVSLAVDFYAIDSTAPARRVFTTNLI